MKKFLYRFLPLAICCVLPSCADWLAEDGPMTNHVGDYFSGLEPAQQVVNAAYTPLMWEYQGTYFSEFFIGDIMSDDALKGGQNIADMSAAYDLENFQAISNNVLVREYYRAHFQGVVRANLAIEQISAMELTKEFTEDQKNTLLGQAYFLRGLYYFRLVRLFGGVPLTESPIYSANGWKVPRASVDEVYVLISSDLEKAAAMLPAKSKYDSKDLGRATRGAAEAMLLKAYLYWGDAQRNAGSGAFAEKYAEAEKWGAEFMKNEAAEYSLCPKYADNFTLAGENGPESVFEVQYACEPTSDYGEGNGFTRGTFATIELRSRSTLFPNVGWGFCHPTKNLMDEYEAEDSRVNATILDPTSFITNPSEEIYLGNPYLCKKRSLFNDKTGSYDLNNDNDDHDSRSPINRIEIRLADVYLLYAEACLRNSNSGEAKIYLEKVRERAREGADILPAFPAYSVPDYRNSYSLHQLTDTPEDLELAIRHERRVELAMESHRWYDICRWGIAAEVMTAYRATETDAAREKMKDFVKGKHELLPIPEEEVRLGGLEQNPKW